MFGPPAPDAEFQALVRKTYPGNAQALCSLGARLVVGRDAPYSPVDGAALLAEAARMDLPEAWSYIGVLAAAGVGRNQDWDEAFDAVHRAAELGDSNATRQLDLLEAANVDGPAHARRWIADAQTRTVCDAPRMIACAEFLPRAWCEHFVELASPRLKRAQVHDYRLGVLREDAMRTNTGTPFSITETDLLVQLVRARIAATAGVSMHALEPFEVLHYSVGERYTYHIDFFHPELPNYRELVGVKGQRAKTCLVYLNDDYDGGETDFSRANVKFRGRYGEALIFDNVRPDGTGDAQTVHAGLAPTRGEKWLLSQWIRDRPQRAA